MVDIMSTLETPYRIFFKNRAWRDFFRARLETVIIINKDKPFYRLQRYFTRAP